MRLRVLNPKWLKGATVKNADGSEYGLVRAVDGDTLTIDLAGGSGVARRSAYDLNRFSRLTNPNSPLPKKVFEEEIEESQ